MPETSLLVQALIRAGTEDQAADRPITADSGCAAPRSSTAVALSSVSAQTAGSRSPARQAGPSSRRWWRAVTTAVRTAPGSPAADDENSQASPSEAE